MEFTQQLIENYAKKIFGFAYSKTSDYHKAEDLSQEIMLTLCGMSIEDQGIENMDAYIYRVCCYVWSKFLRKNKRHWDALNNANVFEYLSGDDNTDEKLIQSELYEKLRSEVMFLSRTRREILIKFYYDNLSGDEIARSMNIPSSTVRWYLKQTRSELKERIDMTTDSIYKPITLSVGHSGWDKSFNMHGLSTDVLMQNICWVCYGEAKTIEEIARTIGVASFYLEDKIETLLYMDYIKKVGSNRYQTNFFIRDSKYMLAHWGFTRDNISPLAMQLYYTVHEAMPKIHEIGFIGSDMSDDELMWYILPVFIHMKINEVDDLISDTLGAYPACPIRKDGSKHWVWAMHDVILDSCEDEGLKDFIRKASAFGTKTRECDDVYSLQYDLAILLTDGGSWNTSERGSWRSFDEDELRQLRRVKIIIENKEIPNEYDKSIISNLVQKGYVSVDGSKISILIPYLNADQMDKLRDILTEQAKISFNNDVMKKLWLDYANTVDKLIPKFIDKDERMHLKRNFWPDSSIMYVLCRDGHLVEPTEEQKMRFCTIVWETK